MKEWILLLLSVVVTINLLYAVNELQKVNADLKNMELNSYQYQHLFSDEEYTEMLGL